MPLSQDDPSLDYDGSWGDASRGWPSISFPTEEEAQRAYVVAWRDAKVPYGSYVLVDKELRLETPELKELVRVALDQDGRCLKKPERRRVLVDVTIKEPHRNEVCVEIPGTNYRDISYDGDRRAGLRRVIACALSRFGSEISINEGVAKEVLGDLRELEAGDTVVIEFAIKK